MYFPSARYTLRVCESMLKACAPGGVCFLGDFRDRGVAAPFHCALALARARRAAAPDQKLTSCGGDCACPALQISVTELNVLARRSYAREKELLLFNDNFNAVGTQSAVLCLLYTSPSPRDATLSRMPSSA